MILKDKQAFEWLEVNSKYFKGRELACKCCQRLVINTDSVALLNKLREMIMQPLFITSAFRCPAHNYSVGGAVSSKHVDGIAYDIFTPGLDFQDKLIDLAKILFPRIIAYHRIEDDTRWIHVDTYPQPYFEDKR